MGVLVLKGLAERLAGIVMELPTARKHRVAELKATTLLERAKPER